MSLLLDTHVFLWWKAADPRLPLSVRRLISSRRQRIWFSRVSLWEITVKQSLGKLEIPDSPEIIERDLLEQGFDIVGLEAAHLERLALLPFHHRDPFDRLLIAQAIHLNARAVTAHPAWKAYPVEICWAG